MVIRRKKTRKRKGSLILGALLLSAAGGLAALFHFPGRIEDIEKGNPGMTQLMETRRERAREEGEAYLIRQVWVPIEKVSPQLRRAVVLAEDKRFFQHHGVDFQSFKEAMKHNWKHKRFCRGGSTITQQVVKNLYLTHDKSIPRKLREMVLAWRMERYLSKRRILELYLNIVEWGKGIYGAEAASRMYFRKVASDLNFNQSLSMVAVLPSPLRHSPAVEGRYLTLRKVQVMRRMKRNGHPVPKGLLESASRRLPWPVTERRLELELENYFIRFSRN